MRVPDEKTKGFNILELIVVLLIIGIVSALGYPEITKWRKDREVKSKGKLKNVSFMFTGKLQNISRAEAKSLIEENAGSIVSSVTKKLDYLVTGEKPTNRKVEQAKNLGIKILTQKEWSDLLN